MDRSVNAALAFRVQQAGTSRLLRHCLSLGAAENRVPARTRLDEALGPDLARRLVGSLTSRGRT